MNLQELAKRLVLGGLVASAINACTTAPSVHTTKPGPVVKVPPSQTLRIAAVGDIMLGTDYPDNRLAGDDGVSLLVPVYDHIRRADIAFGNLEGVLLNGGEAAKSCSNPRYCYLFRMPERYVWHLKAAGFDVLSLANNHARDFGEAGWRNTEKVLDQARIHHSGRYGDVASWTVKGVRVAMIAFAPFRGSHSMLNVKQAEARVRQLAASHDLVMVSMHGGAEGDEALRIPFAVEVFHGEKRGDVVAFSRAVIDAGADLVLGHGPHVPRALELYRGRLVAYSLGNFCTYYGINVRDVNGLAPILDVDVDSQGRFLGGRIHSFRQLRPAGPMPDGMHMAAQTMAELTLADFPEGRLQVGIDGSLETLARPVAEDDSAAPPLSLNMD